MPLALAAALSVAPAIQVETLRSIGGLPAHIVGAFGELSTCEQAADGEYFVFDRRAHAVFSVPPSFKEARNIVRIGAEPGHLLRPSAFDLANDGTFVVADAPGNRGRIQVFFSTGASLGGFTLATREAPMIVLGSLVMSGIASIEYTGRSVLISQPEVGALVTEYAMDGRTVRTFGELRPTGHEQDRDVHLALNAGLVVSDPRGGFYFVFLGGTPMFRKYDAAGKLLFERHVEGIELDEYIRTMPNSWPRRRTAEGGELPIVPPSVRAAAADKDGNLWISLSVPYTYVFDPSGDKRRVVQFRAAGIISPISLYFTHDMRVLVTPGCYAFPAR
jgi:hypothetical protein